VYHNNTQHTVSPWSRKSKTSTCIWYQDSFPQSSLLMTVLPFSLLDFSGFRFCVINHVSALKLLSLISVTCPKNTRKAHTVPYNELSHHLWDSLAPSVYPLLCNPVGPGQFCALLSECLALWQSQQLNVSVCHASPAVDMLGAQSTFILPLLKVMHHIYACFHGITYTAYTFTNWCNMHHTQK